MGLQISSSKPVETKTCLLSQYTKITGNDYDNPQTDLAKIVLTESDIVVNEGDGSSIYCSGDVKCDTNLEALEDAANDLLNVISKLNGFHETNPNFNNLLSIQSQLNFVHTRLINRTLAGKLQHSKCNGGRRNSMTFNNITRNGSNVHVDQVIDCDFGTFRNKVFDEKMMEEPAVADPAICQIQSPAQSNRIDQQYQPIIFPDNQESDDQNKSREWGSDEILDLSFNQFRAPLNSTMNESHQKSPTNNNSQLYVDYSQIENVTAPNFNQSMDPSTMRELHNTTQTQAVFELIQEAYKIQPFDILAVRNFFNMIKGLKDTLSWKDLLLVVVENIARFTAIKIFDRTTFVEVGHFNLTAWEMEEIYKSGLLELFQYIRNRNLDNNLHAQDCITSSTVELIIIDNEEKLEFFPTNT